MTARRIAAVKRDALAGYPDLVLLAWRKGLRAALAVLERHEPEEEPAPSHEPYHQGNLPPGETRDSYLRKARAGAFQTSKTGRAVLCNREDWDSYVASRVRKPSPPRAAAANDTRGQTDRELLESVGVALRPARK